MALICKSMKKYILLLLLLLSSQVSLYALDQLMQWGVSCNAWGQWAPDGSVKPADFVIKVEVTDAGGAEVMSPITSFTTGKLWIDPDYLTASMFYINFDIGSYPAIQRGNNIKVTLTWGGMSAVSTYKAGTGNSAGMDTFDGDEGLVIKVPDPTISIGNKAFCQGTTNNSVTATISNVPADFLTNGYTIDWGDTNVATGAVSGTGPYTVIGNIGAGLTATTGNLTPKLLKGGVTVATGATYKITVNPLPTVKINAGNAVELCKGQAKDITASVTSGTATFKWTTEGNATGATKSITRTTVSDITVEATITATGCKNTQTVTPTVLELPTVTLDADKDDVCAGTTVTLTATANGGSGTYTNGYTWSGGATGTGATSTPAVAAGEKEYGVKVKDSKGCISAAEAKKKVTGHSVTVTAPAPISVNNGEKANVSATVTFTPSGGEGSSVQYVWNPVLETVNLDKKSGQTPVLTTPGQNKFNLKVTDSYTCSANADVIVNVGNAGAALAANPTATNGGVGCTGATAIELDAMPSGGQPVVPGQYTYTWSVTGGITLSDMNARKPKVTNTTAVSGTVSVVVGDGTTTVTGGPVTITLKATPLLTSVTPSKTTVDVGETVTLTANPQLTDGTTYTWTGTALPAGNAATITTSALTSAGPQTYTVTATKDGCTSAQQTTTVTVEGGGTPTPGDPNILLTIEKQACLGSGDKMQIKMAGQGGDSFQFDLWHGGSVKKITGGLGPWYHDVAQADQGLYEIKNLQVLKDGAWITVTSNSNVNATFRNLPAVKIQGLGDGVVTMNHCDNEKLTLSGAGDLGVKYQWNAGVNNGQPFTPTDGMVYTVIGTDAFGCENTASVTVTLLQAPVVKIEPLPVTEICQGNSVKLGVTMASNANTYAWNPTIPADGNVTPVMTTKYSVTGIAANGCKNADSVLVTVNIAPEILATSKNPRTIAIGKNVDFSIVADRADTYKWEYRKNAADAWTTLSDMPATATTPSIEGATTDKLLLTKVPRGWDGMNLKVSALNQCGSVDTIFHLFVKECFDIEGSIAMAEGIQPEETPGENVDGWYCKGMKISLKATIRPEDPSNAVENPRYKWMIDGEPSDKVIESDSSVLSWIPASWESDIVVKVGVYSDGACDTVYSRYLRLKAREYDDVSVKIISSGDPELTYCLGEEIVFSVAPKNPGKNPVYTWQKDVSGLGTGEFKVLKMSQPSTWIKVTMTPSPEVCVRGIVSDSIYLTVKPTANPKMWITNTINDTLACSGDRIFFQCNYNDAGENPKISWQKDIQWNIGNGQFAEAVLSDRDMWIKCTLIPGKNVCYDGAPLADSMVIRTLEHGTVTITSDMDGKEPGDELTFTSKVENMPMNPMYEWFINANLTSEPSDTYISSVLRQGDVVALAVSGEKICHTRVFSNEIVVNFNKSSRDTMVEIYRNEKIHKLNMFKTGDQVNRFMLSELPKFGRAVMTPSGLFDYYPNPDFVGSDFVKYTITNKYDKTKVEEGYIYITVKSIDRYFIPNIITPNEDGVNDTWKLEFLSEYPDHIVTVYNWLGKVVFQAKKYGNDWGGKGLNNASYVSQANLPNGVYTYVIDLGNKVILKGWIEIRADFNRGNYR